MNLGFYYSPGTILNEMNATDAAFTLLDMEITENNTPEAFQEKWGVFRDKWEEFYKNNKDYLSRMTFQTYRQTMEYRNELQKWKEAYESTGQKSRVPTFDIRKARAGLPWFKIAATVGVIGAVWFLVKSE